VGDIERRVVCGKEGAGAGVAHERLLVVAELGEGDARIAVAVGNMREGIAPGIVMSSILSLNYALEESARVVVTLEGLLVLALFRQSVGGLDLTMAIVPQSKVGVEIAVGNAGGVTELVEEGAGLLVMRDSLLIAVEADESCSYVEIAVRDPDGFVMLVEKETRFFIMVERILVQMTMMKRRGNPIIAVGNAGGVAELVEEGAGPLIRRDGLLVAVETDEGCSGVKFAVGTPHVGAQGCEDRVGPVVADERLGVVTQEMQHEAGMIVALGEAETVMEWVEFRAALFKQGESSVETAFVQERSHVVEKGLGDVPRCSRVQGCTLCLVVLPRGRRAWMGLLMLGHSPSMSRRA